MAKGKLLKSFVFHKEIQRAIHAAPDRGNSTEQRAGEVKSRRGEIKEREYKGFSPRLFFLQVRAGSRKCVSTAALSAVGLTVKEKLGGERECGTESGN